jgi:hypothetical protein
MRPGLIILSLLALSCSPPEERNEAAGRAGGRGPGAVVVASSGGGQGCSYRWDGEPVSQEELLAKGVKLIMHAIEDVGGIEKITEENMPYPRLEASAGEPYSCTGPALREMRRAGFAHVMLKTPGAASPDQRADFPMVGYEPRPEHAVVRLEKDGRITWNGEAVDKAGLGERARLAATMRPPVDLFVAPSADSDFATLHEAMRAIEAANMEASLSGCAGTTGPVLETSPVC